MSVKINYLDGGSYTAQNDRALAGALLSPGVLNGFGVSADSPADLAVSVAAGVARVGADGYLVTSDAAVLVTIVANTSGYNRIDMIVIDVDDTANPIKALQGIPSSSPVAPTPGANQLPLALITVGNNASVINSNVITDDRTYSISKLLAGGWSPLPAATYASASSFTLPGDLHLLLERGTKIKLTQGTDKYFYVYPDATYSSSTGLTTVPVVGGLTYSLSNAAITSPCFSKAEDPSGFPDYLPWADTIAGSGSMTVSDVAIDYALFRMSGKSVHIYVSGAFTTGGTANNAFTMQLPIPIISVTNPKFPVDGYYYDPPDASGGYGKACGYCVSKTQINIAKYNNALFNLGAGRAFSISGDYLT